MSTTYFQAGKPYYFRLECLKGTYSFSASLNIHNHCYTNLFVKAVADDDKENRLNGFSKLLCNSCGNEYIVQNIYAPSTVKLSSTKIAFNPYGSYPSVTVYDSVGNLISPRNMLSHMMITLRREKRGYTSILSEIIIRANLLQVL